MEQPEVKAKMEELRTAQEQQRERDYAMVFKALDRRQGSLFRKMLGKKFDVQLAMAGMFRGPGQRNGPVLPPRRKMMLPRPILPNRQTAQDRFDLVFNFKAGHAQTAKPTRASRPGRTTTFQQHSELSARQSHPPCGGETGVLARAAAQMTFPA